MAMRYKYTENIRQDCCYWN